MMAMLKALVGVGLVFVAGCSVSVAAEADAGSDAPADVADAAPPLFDRGPAECDGTQYADLCRGYHYGYAYGVPVACTGNPWRPVGDRAQFRKNDPDASTAECGTFSQAGVTCCAE